MSTNFNRNRSQLFCEGIFGCTTLEQWGQVDFKSLVLNPSQASTLSSNLKSDAFDLYYKGILSLFDALKSLEDGLYSWATIKIYYSVFYLLKCTLALNDVAIVRQKSLFYLKALDGETPVSKSNKKYNSDHSGTINFYIDLFSSDVLLTQQIEGTNAYEWLMHKREQINYREREFNEPGVSSFWSYINQQITKGNIENLLASYVSDTYILCFQEEHAILALPIKRALLTRDRFLTESIPSVFSKEQAFFLTNLLPYDNSDLKTLIF